MSYAKLQLLQHHQQQQEWAYQEELQYPYRRDDGVLIVPIGCLKN